MTNLGKMIKQAQELQGRMADLQEHWRNWKSLAPPPAAWSK
jgi:DNA-binding protein YbaB